MKVFIIFFSFKEAVVTTTFYTAHELHIVQEAMWRNN